MVLVLRGPRDAYARSLAAGLFASAVGDVLLVDGGMFVWGLAAFLVAHLFYLGAFLVDVRRRAAARLLPFLAWGALGFAAIRPGLGTLEAPVVAYIGVLMAMMWRAAARLGFSPRGRESALWGAGGALLFGLSDTLLALDRFRGEVPAARYLVILLYWAGQLGLARSARLERSSEQRAGARAT
jgi:uncharacterized membrane protein YhhN